MFDQMIVDKARENGAEVREEHKVLGLIRDEDEKVVGVTAEDSSGNRFEFHASMLLMLRVEIVL